MKESELHEGERASRSRLRWRCGNAVNRMISKALKVQFIAVNTDSKRSNAARRREGPDGQQVTRGLARAGDGHAGANAPTKAERAFGGRPGVRHGLHHGRHGRRHGTGSAAIVAELAKEGGALTIGVVTGRSRSRAASATTPRGRDQGPPQPGRRADRHPNDRLPRGELPRRHSKRSLPDGDDVLRQGVQGISDLVTQPGVHHLDLRT